MVAFLVSLVVSVTSPKVEVMTFPVQTIIVCTPECQARQALSVIRRQVQRMDYR